MEAVQYDLKKYLQTNIFPSRTVLVFPPFNGFRRFLIHKLIEDNFASSEVAAFSIGQDISRRIVVCYKGLIREGQNNTTVKQRPGLNMIDKDGPSRQKPTPSAAVYRPPAARMAESRRGAPHSRPSDGSKRTRVRRPDQQMYVPRPKRASYGNDQPVSRSPSSSRTSLDSDSADPRSRLSPQKNETPNTSRTKDVSSDCLNGKNQSQLCCHEELCVKDSDSTSNGLNKDSPASKDHFFDVGDNSIASERVLCLPADFSSPSEEHVKLNVATSSEKIHTEDGEGTLSKFAECENLSEHSELKRVGDMQIDAEDSKLNSSKQSSIIIDRQFNDELVNSKNDKCMTDTPTQSQDSSSDSSSSGSSESLKNKKKPEIMETISISSDSHKSNSSESSSDSRSSNSSSDSKSEESSKGKSVEKMDVEHSVSGKEKDADNETSDTLEHNSRNKRNFPANVSDILIISDTSSSSDMSNTGMESKKESLKEKPKQSSTKKEKVVNPVKKSKIVNPDECDWESLYDDSGECLVPDLMEELTSSIGRVRVTSADSDYRPFQSIEERTNDGECIIEIYDFPAEFKTTDLFNIFAAYRSKNFQIKWVDDTHALGVFPSPLMADEVLGCTLPFVKTRPLRLAITESRNKARGLVLPTLPSAERPKTCVALARRLVSGALGLRLPISSQEREQEKQALKEAREKRRLEAKQREAAWEGTFTSESCI